jgi:nucleotide-binding universal stress UspA family protein
VSVSEASRATTIARILLAVEAVPQSQEVIGTAVKLARRSQAAVVVLSVRERDFGRGFVWDVRPPGEIAETVGRAVFQLRRAGVDASGLIRTARSGRVADEIVHAAHELQVSEIVIGASRRSWLGRLLMGSIAPRVLRLSDLPVLTVPTHRFMGASA